MEQLDSLCWHDYDRNFLRGNVAYGEKKLENWIYWIIGDLISVPLYLYKGLVFTSFQYLLFTIIAIYGYRAWKKNLNIPETSLLNW